MALVMLTTTSFAHVLPRDAPKTCNTPPMPANLPELPKMNETHRIAQAAAAINIWVYTHVVTTNAARDKYPVNQVDYQIAVLNDRFASAGIFFVHVGSDRTVNDAWARAISGPDRDAMANALHKGDYRSLNLYYQSDMSAAQPGLLGYAYFPNHPTPADYRYDAAYINAETLPYGSIGGYNFGLTTIHEVGHWLGLDHTFADGKCDGAGDGVADTPAQATPPFSCTGTFDSCPGQPGLDPVHNYMNYVPDTCATEFTKGQTDRMFLAWNYWRTYV
ncbi:Extracellular metalloprotease-like protein 3 [Elsinoe fawcettii]|nr:Extracellular metalloprotease-like protein 3 [Elsinoe fawcettii]